MDVGLVNSLEATDAWEKIFIKKYERKLFNFNTTFEENSNFKFIKIPTESHLSPPMSSPNQRPLVDNSDVRKILMKRVLGMAYSLDAATNTMDSEVNSNEANSEIEKFPLKDKDCSYFDLQEPQANDEDQDDADGVTTAEVKTDIPLCNNASSFLLEHNEKHQHSMNENFTLVSGNKTSNIDILEKHSGDSLQQKKESSIQEYENKLCINTVGDKKSIKGGKVVCQVSPYIFQCSGASAEALLMMPRSNIKLKTKSQYIKLPKRVLWGFAKTNIQDFTVDKWRKLRKSNTVIILKKNEQKGKILTHYKNLRRISQNKYGRVFCKQENKTNNSKEEKKVSERQSTHSVANTLDGAHEDKDYDAFALNKNQGFVIGEKDHHFPEKTDRLDNIFNDKNANATCHDDTEFEPLVDNTNKAEASLSKVVDVTLTTSRECDNLQDQTAEVNGQILNFSSSKDCFPDNYVKGCPSQTTNANLTDLAVRIFEQNKDFGCASAAKKNIDALSKQTTDSDILVRMEIGSNLKTCDTKLFVTSENATSDSGTQLVKQSKHSLSTDDQILPSSSHEKTVQNIANTNTYNSVSQEANSGEAFYVYNFKGKEEKETTDLRKDQTVFVSDKDEECNISINAEESNEQFEYVLNERKKLCAQETVMEDQISCPLWKILNKLECPFTWLPDIKSCQVSGDRLKMDMVKVLTAKEKSFSKAKTNLFREIVVHLVIAYEKVCEDNLIDAFADLSHCYELLGNPQFIPDGMQLDFKDLHITPGKGNECYKKIKERRAQAMENATRYHALQFSADSPICFLDPVKYLSYGQNYQTEREMKLSNVHHLLNSSAEQSTAMAQDKTHQEKATRNEVENDLMYEEEFVDIDKEIIEGKKERRTSENNVSQLVPHMGGNLIESSELNTRKESTFVTEADSLEINNKEMAYSKGITINKPTVDSEDSKCNSNNISKRYPSDESPDVKLEEMEPKYDIPKLSHKYDETKGIGKAALIEEERKAALHYAVTAVVAYVAYLYENFEESYVAAQVCKYRYSQLGKSGIAALLALKASVFMEYGMSGNQLGLPYLREAVSLDPDYWEWCLLYGKVLGRVRLFLKGPCSLPDDEEIQMLEKAAELNPNNATCLVSLATMYTSIDKYYFKNAKGKTNQTTKNAMQNKRRIPAKLLSAIIPSYSESVNKGLHITQSIHTSVQPEWDYCYLARMLYLRALKLEEHCPYTSARCAKALWVLPNPYKEKEISQKAILHAVTLAPSVSLVNHYAGIFYDCAGDKVKALEYFKRAVSGDVDNYSAEFNYLYLKTKMNHGGCSPLIHIDHILNKYPNHQVTIKTLCFKGYYLYKVEKKILLAIRSITAALVMDPKGGYSKKFYPVGYDMHLPPVNIYELLEEILLNFRRSPPKIFNHEYWNGILDIATKFCKEYNNNKETDSASAI